MSRHSHFHLLFVCVVLPTLATSARAQRHYRVTPLTGTYSGGITLLSSTPTAINNVGQVAGYADARDGTGKSLGRIAFLWDNGLLTNPGNLGTDTQGVGVAAASSLNDAGQAVGTSVTFDSSHNSTGLSAFFWQNSGLSVLNANLQYPDKINGKGAIAGYTVDRLTWAATGYLLQNGTLTTMGNFGTDAANHSESRATGINSTGQMALYATLYNSSHVSQGVHAYARAANSTLTDVGNLGTDSGGRGAAYATDLNDKGQVVGYSSAYDGSHNDLGFAAFVWQNGVLTNLGNLGTDAGGQTNVFAEAINNRGDVVGNGETFAGGQYAGNAGWLWSGGTMRALNSCVPADAGLNLTDAPGINDAGQIIAVHTVGQTPFACLLTPDATGDVDGDGQADLLWQNNATGSVAAWLLKSGTLAGTINVAGALGTQWQVAATPDLDGNGQADIVWRNTTSGDVAYWLRAGSSITATGTLASSVPLDWNLVGTGAFRHSTHRDLVWQNRTTGEVAIWVLNGLKVAETASLATGIGSAWSVAGVGDLDGDGYDDIVWRNTVTGDVAYWQMQGSKLVQGRILANAVPLTWRLAGLTDRENTGHLDVLWQNTASGDVYAWKMNGTTVLSSIAAATGIGTDWKLVGAQ